MLNKKNSTNSNFWKAGLIIPALLAFLLIFNVKTVAQVKEQNSKAAMAETMDVVATVTQHSTKEELDNITKNFEKQGVIINFKEVKRNPEGLITDISVSVKNSTTNTSASYIKNDPDGIQTFQIYSRESGETGISDSQPANRHPFYRDSTFNHQRVKLYVTSKDSIAGDTIFFKGNGHSFAKTKGDPVYVMNGTALGNAAVAQNIAPANINSIMVLKGTSATSLYGKAAKDGAVVITTKEGDSLSTSVAGVKTHSNRIYYTSGKYTPTEAKRVGITSATYAVKDSAKNGSAYYIKKPGALRISTDGVNVGTSNSFGGSSQVFIASTDDQNPPLYVLEGEILEENFNLEKIDHNNIESINVLKGDAATKKYGEKGKNGVVEINLKDKNAKANPAGTFSVIKASTTEEGLKITKQQLQKQSNLRVDFSNIKRNRDGLIREIKVIAKTDNEEIIGTFSETESINDIYVGVINNKIYISSNAPKN